MNRKTVLSVVFTLVVAAGLAACAGKPAPTPEPPTSTPEPPPTEVVPPTPVEVTVIVPMTVVVPETVVVTATPEPATPVPPTEESLSATPAAPLTPSDTPLPTQPQAAGTQLVELPPMRSTPQALNGPDPMAGVTGQQFAEFFAPPDFWGTGDDADSTVSIADGKMTIVNKKQHSFVWTFNGIKGTDFYSQVFLTPRRCNFGDNYGLSFRAKDDMNLDLFGVSCEGRYRLMEISQGKTSTVIDWTDSKYIRKFETTNVVGVRAVGDQISLYVNNYYLTTVTASANTAGRFGLYVGNIATPNLTVDFQALTASRISP